MIKFELQISQLPWRSLRSTTSWLQRVKRLLGFWEVHIDNWLGLKSLTTEVDFFSQEYLHNPPPFFLVGLQFWVLNSSKYLFRRSFGKGFWGPKYLLTRTAPPWKWAANHHVSGYNLFFLGSVPSPCIFAACFTLWEIRHFRQTSGDGTWVDSLKVFLKSQPDKMQRTKSTHFSLSTSISLRDPRWCFGILKDFTLNEIPQTSIHLVIFGMYSGSWMREG